VEIKISRFAYTLVDFHTASDPFTTAPVSCFDTRSSSFRNRSLSCKFTNLSEKTRSASWRHNCTNTLSCVYVDLGVRKTPWNNLERSFNVNV
jgi:hypothetical protein